MGEIIAFIRMLVSVVVRIGFHCDKISSGEIGGKRDVARLRVRHARLQSASAFGGATSNAPASASQQNASDVVSEAAAAVEKAKPVRTGPKVGRNDPCPCGSGKKYKQCCGK